VRRETIGILKYITEQKESEDLFALYIKNVFLRQDVLDNLTELFIGGATRAIDNQQTQDIFTDFLIRVAYNQKVKDGVLDSLVYSPMRSFFTFGYGGVSNDQLK
jgi:hypothetical protein